MRTALVACATIRVEFEAAFKASQTIPDEIRWIKSGLHNVGDSLRMAIQDELCRLESIDKVLLGFGACGNALVGIKTGPYSTILPRVDDCISLMLGSFARKRAVERVGATYFLSNGWLAGESNIYLEYLQCVRQFGREMAEVVYQEMLGRYVYLGVIDSKAGDYGTLLKQTEEIAQALHLEQLPLEGTLEYLTQLLSGPWSSKLFLVVPPETTITHEMLRI